MTSPKIDAGPLSALNGKTQKLLQGHLAPGESVQICLVGNSSQALIATDRRLMVAKAGIMAGATFGGTVTSFNFGDVNGIEVQTHITTAVIEVITAGYQNREVSYWSSDKKSDPYKLPNCVPIQKSQVPGFQAQLHAIRELIFAAKNPAASAAPSAPPADLAGALERVVALHAAGALNEGEFAAAKSRIFAA